MGIDAIRARKAFKPNEMTPETILYLQHPKEVLMEEKMARYPKADCTEYKVEEPVYGALFLCHFIVKHYAFSTHGYASRGRKDCHRISYILNEFS